MRSAVRIITLGTRGEVGPKHERSEVEGGLPMLKVELVKERETKRTWRYQEVKGESAEEVVGTLYVQKSALESAFGKTPERLAVTIEEKKAQ